LKKCTPQKRSFSPLSITAESFSIGRPEVFEAKIALAPM